MSAGYGRSVRPPLVYALLLLVAPTGCAPPAVPADMEPLDGPVWVFLAPRGEASPALPVHERAQARRAREGRRDPLPADHPVDRGRVEALEDLGLRVRTTSRWLNAVSVEPVGEAWSELQQLDGVVELRPVARSLPRWAPPSSPQVLRDEPPPSLLDYGPAAEQVAQIRADAMHGLGYTGQGVVVALTDTGFLLEHEALAPLVPRVLGTLDTTQGDLDVGQNPGDDADQVRHGTLVLSALAASLDGTLVGVAPDVSLLLAKTERTTTEEAVEEDYWIAGVEWAEARGADVLTSSLGWIDWYEPEDLDGQTATSTQFINELVDVTGLLVTVSAANLGPGAQTLAAPADSPFVIAVAAANALGSVAAFSSRGPTADGRIKPDVAARGVDVHVVDWTQDSGLNSSSGTSMAAPLVAGGVALLRQAHPEWTRSELVEALLSTASRADAPDTALGWGVIDVYAACGLACSCRDEDGDGSYAQDCGGDDCDDLEASTHPGALESCDGVDSACEGLDPAEVDGDDDGSLPCAGDCDDADPDRDALDRDGDGVSTCDGDCDDGDPDRSPVEPERPYDGVDQDCDGADLVDQDGDGFAGGPDGPDCRDLDSATWPDPLAEDGSVSPRGGHELCRDGRDNDCDGLRDGEDEDCMRPDMGEEVVTSSGSLGGCTCSQGPSGAPLLALLLLGRRRRHMVPGSRVPSPVQ